MAPGTFLGPPCAGSSDESPPEFIALQLSVPFGEARVDRLAGLTASVAGGGKRSEVTA